MSNAITQNTTDAWMLYMLAGDFDKAWIHSDFVLKTRAGKPCWHLPRHQQYVWDGSSLKNKKVLVRCYHGLGDTIQFIRYMPLLKSLARYVIVWAQPELIPLLGTVKGIDELLPLHNGTPEAAYDVDVEIMELPHIFRTTADTIPAGVPYLHVAPTLPAHNKPVVGLVWRAGGWDERRSIPFDLLRYITQIPDIEFYILQEHAAQAGWTPGYGHYPGEFSLAEYAAIVKGLDLLITVDSMPAHLGGALGIPVWTLLHSQADWRWMKDRDDTPWYPTMRLIRQQQAGDWKSVLDEVMHRLTALSITLQGKLTLN